MSEEAHQISIITSELAREIQRLKQENEQQALLIAVLQNKERENSVTQRMNNELNNKVVRMKLENSFEEQRSLNVKLQERYDFLAEQSQNARNALLKEYETSAVHFRNVLSIVNGTTGDIECLKQQLDTYIACTGYLDDDSDSDSDSDSSSKEKGVWYQ